MANAANTNDIEKVNVEVDVSCKASTLISTRESTFDCRNNVALEAQPRGRWGWVVCLGAFFIQFFMLGVQNSAGIIYTALVDEFKTPRGVTAWVGSLATGMMFFLGPLTTSLCERYGCRIVAITGTIFCISGLVFSSFVKTVPVLFFTYGIIWGAGTSMCYFPTVIVLSKYFRTRLALVNGIVCSGSGVGTLAMGPFVQFLLARLGIANGLRAIAAILTPLILCGATFRPVPASCSETSSDSVRKKKKRRKFFDWEIFKNKGYVVWSACLSIYVLGYFVPFVHLVRNAEDMNISSPKASLLIGYLSIASTFGRLLFGKIADFSCINRFHLYQFGFLVMALCSIFVTMVKDYAGLVVYAVIFGLFEGGYVVLIPVITSDIVGPDKLSYALGSMFTFMAFPMMLGPPIAGWIYDLTKDYTVAFYLCGVTSFLPACLMFLVPSLTPPRKDSPSSSSPSTPRRQEVTTSDNESNDSTKSIQQPKELIRSYYGPGLLNDRRCLYEAPHIEIIKALSLAKL